jgi:ATP-dependent helicase/nuclease subunit A
MKSAGGRTMGHEVSSNPTTRRWTPQQWAGISTHGKSLLVSAAAGSGKTTVLAERCVHLVCDAAEPCDVDDLLVVTFTDAAANEMRARITSALRRRAAEAPSERLNRQLALVDQAQVSTLHAFCARLLRRHFHLVGLAPDFKVMDADEAFLLRRETAANLFERRYDDEDGRFASLIDGYGQGNDASVLRQLLHVHELLTSVVDPAGWIARSRGRIDEAVEKPPEKSELGRELLQTIRRGLTAAQARCGKAIDKVGRIGFRQYADYLADIGAALRRWLKLFQDGGLDALTEAVKDFQLGRLPSVAAAVPGKEVAKSLVDAVRDEITEGSWRDILRFSAQQWRDGLRAIRPHTDLFLGLVEQFNTEYQQAKRALHALDFADLERFTLAVLNEREGGILLPSPAARTFHRRFAHVLVDEYQDINEVQDAILSLVSRECIMNGGGSALAANLFCVGDVKQSIYRFRLAEPARFLERQRQFRGPESHGHVIDLQSNFRSRLPLLDALNSVFARLMTAEAVDIEYDQSHFLKGAIEYPQVDAERTFNGAPIELHLLPDELPELKEDADPVETAGEAEELDRAAREGVLVARQIRRILGQDGGEPMLVMEKDAAGKLSPRPARPRDIVILLRSMKFKADQYASALRQAGIPVYAASNAGYFESMEVRDMLALLSLLDNQRQDIPVASILRSPLGNLPDAETSLARIRAAYPAAVPFHDAALRYAKDKTDSLASHLNAFFAQLQQWREAAQFRPLADVIWTIYRQSGYLTYVAGLPMGEQRVKNLTHLHERAAQFGNFQSRGLSRFMRFLEQLREEADMGQPSIASEAEDVVRVISIHRSKGLEFPIVIVPDLGKRINFQSCRGPILADRDAGLGMVVVDEAKRCRYPSLASTLVQNRLKQQTLAEELRVLYVAMTRAREHLILIGTCGEAQPDSWASRWEGHEGALPRDSILSATTMLDWLVPVAMATAQDRPEIFRPTVHRPDEVAGWSAVAAARPKMTAEQLAMARLEPLPQEPVMTEGARRAIERLSFVYPYQHYSALRGAQSVTSRGHLAPREGPDPAQARASQRAIAEQLPRRPKFLERAALTAADRGTATHLVLEHLDFAGACDASDVIQQIETLVQRRILTIEEAAVVDRDAIAWLLSSSIGQVMRRDPAAVRRELPVNFPAPAELPGDAPPSGDPLDRVMVRGRIDVLIVRQDSAILLDYKTDALTPEEVPARAETYRPQLQAYREAIERIAGRTIGEVYLAFLTPRVLFAMA